MIIINFGKEKICCSGYGQATNSERMKKQYLCNVCACFLSVLSICNKHNMGLLFPVSVFYLCTDLFHMILPIFPSIHRKCLKLQLWSSVHHDIRLMGNGKHVVQTKWATESHSCHFSVIWHLEGEDAIVAGGFYGCQYIK